MAITFSTATRKRARLRLGIMGAAGSGKTYGALRLGLGITSAEKIFLVDTERHSAELYAHLGKFQTACIERNFDPIVYTDYIHAAEAAGAEIIIIDSLSHAWEGEGGALDQVDNKANGGNSFTAWKDITPKHRSLVDAMLQSPCHIIATLRAKQEYVLEKDERTGKTVPRKVALAPVQRQGMEYEFTTFLDVDDAHMARASKDRTSLLDNKSFQLSEDVGRKLLVWLNTGPAPERKVGSGLPPDDEDIALPTAADPARTALLQASISAASNLTILAEVGKQVKDAEAKLSGAELAGLRNDYANKRAKLKTEAEGLGGEPAPSMAEAGPLQPGDIPFEDNPNQKGSAA